MKNNYSVPEKPESVTWTDEQWEAIWAKGQDILVAAAAGSGKTAVLVERIINKILSVDDPLNVDELLVVTFTNLAAAEMRHRIGEALEKEINENPTSRHLRKQLSLLNKASISTLHSFCLEVIQKYYYKIDIDPGFRIANETEIQILRDEVLEELLEEEYGKEGNENFFKLVDTFSNDRSDEALFKMIQNLYDFSRANPIPEKYLDLIIDMYRVDEHMPIDNLPFMKELLFDIDLQLHEAEELLKKGYELTLLPGGPAPRADNFQDDLRILEGLHYAKNDSWETLYHAMQKLSFSRAKPCKGEEYEKKLVDKAQKLRDKGKKILTSLQEEYFSRRPESFVRDMKEMAPYVKILVELVKRFSERFQAVKQEKGIADFGDLEHYCLQILGNADENGNFVPTEVAQYYQTHFKEVFVDEYQDTNMVQETILKLVTNGEKGCHLFMVGDVKQSIYRFRLAEPNLFLEKYHLFAKNNESDGLTIDLARNFRSRKEILDGTNYIFKQLMGGKVGEIDYEKKAELVKGAPYPDEKNEPIDVFLIDLHEEGEDNANEEENEELLNKEDLKQSQLEAKVMANEIKKMIVEGKEIYNPKTKSSRKVMYRDIVILLRSFAWAPQIMDEFKDQGIPVYADLSTGYFEATEVSIMLSLLKTIDNPYQDIPLAAVLRSPIVGLNEEDLARLRIHQRSGSFYEVLKFFSDTKPSEKEEVLHEKVCKFLEQLEVWRTDARQEALSDFIWQLYRDTGFFDFVGGLPGGKQRQANLRALYDRARQYEETSFRGLFRFLRFIERMQDRGDDLGKAHAIGEQEDVVRLMTIHSSKGLEFPVVFIAGLSRQFNFQDLRGTYMLDKQYGFASKYINPDKRIAYPSLPLQAFKKKKKLEMLAEEMRVLYVALTRAKEKLILIASVKNLEKKKEKWADHLSNHEWLLSDYSRAQAKSYLDWIGPALVRHRDGTILRNGEEISTHIPSELKNHPSVWNFKVFKKEELSKMEEQEVNEEENLLEKVFHSELIPIESEWKETVEHQLTWKYPAKDAVSKRSKQSVSEIKRQREFVDETSSNEIVRKIRKPILGRPKFLQEKLLTPAEKGTAMHMVMQHIDFRADMTETYLQRLLEDMIHKELLTTEQANVIDFEEIIKFFQTELGQRMKNAKLLKREVPFSAAFSSKEIYPNWTGREEPILVQGIIDCIFEDEKGLVLLDYKTDGIHDRFKGGFEQAKPILMNRYHVQVQLYAKAYEQIMKRKINEKYLFFFDGGHILPVQ